MRSEVWRYINTSSHNWPRYSNSLWLRENNQCSICIESPGDRSLVGDRMNWIFNEDWFEIVDLKQRSFRSLYDKLSS